MINKLRQCAVGRMDQRGVERRKGGGEGSAKVTSTSVWFILRPSVRSSVVVVSIHPLTMQTHTHSRVEITDTLLSALSAFCQAVISRIWMINTILFIIEIY